MDKRSYNWTITCYSAEMIKFDDSYMTYLAYQPETCPKSGKKHYQGFICLKNAKTLSALLKLIGPHHLEVMKGTIDQNERYCSKARSKNGDFVEFGIKPSQGKRSDLIEVKKTALTRGMRGCVDETYNYQQLRTAEIYLKHREPCRNWKPFVLWIWGPSGSGKSKIANLIAGSEAYRKSSNNKWFEGYDAHDTVILDDFRSSWFSLTDLLDLLDCYETRVEHKGGSRQFLARLIIITTVQPPTSAYEFCAGEPKRQITRRISKILQIC